MANLADIGQATAPAPPQSVPVIPDVKVAPRVPLAPAEEQQFQKEIRATPWHQEFVAKYGEAPNFDDPNYNYRAAWKAGIMPTQRNQVDGQYHWGDSTPNGELLKSVNHPTAWMEPFMRQYPGANPEDPKDPRIPIYKQAWQEKYPPPAPQAEGKSISEILQKIGKER